MDGGRLIHGEDLEGLIAALAALDQRDDARTFENCLVTVAAQARDMQQNVLHAVVRHDEAETLGDVEPLDDTGDFDEIDGIPGQLVDIRRIPSMKSCQPCRQSLDYASHCYG